MNACGESGVRRSRIITPAFTHACVPFAVATRAVIVPSPVHRCHTNWNASAVPHTSAPEPRTVKVPADADASPRIATAPISCEAQGDGSAGGGGGGADTVTVTPVVVAIAPALSTARAVSV